MTSPASNTHQPQEHLSPVAPASGERPLSLYDNLYSTSSSSSGGGSGRVIQFPDIQFRFDESIPDRRSVHSSAKSDFFGLSPTPTAAPPTQPTSTNTTNSTTSPIAVPDVPGTPVRSNDAGSGVPTSSPTSSGASTAPARSPSVSPSSVTDIATEPATSTPRCSRPNSTIKTITIKLPDSSSPSEAVYMTTTVPQNFTKNANTLIGRHKPTRSSLRHSRMLVVNKTIPMRYPPGNSLNLHHLKTCRALMILLILIGLMLNVIGLAIMVWSPSTSTKDNPYWSGLILILCGVLFLVLFGFKRSRTGTIDKVVSRLNQPHQSPWRERCFHFLRVNALLVLLLTIFFTMLAFIYALIHTTNLSADGLRCEPQFAFNVNSSMCVCTIDTRTDGATPVDGLRQANDTTVGYFNGYDASVPEGVIRMEYRDFNCNEVHSIWYYVMIVSTLLNSSGCLLAAIFLVIYSIEWLRRAERYPPRVRNGLAGVKHETTTATNQTSVALLDAPPVPPPREDINAAATSPNTSLLSDPNDTLLAAEENTLTTILSGTEHEQEH
uniref:Uncharacterized protein n=1 Tax=Anopheles farauti TaxID=69004 RepID=A0A182QQY5_9DIPT